MRGKCNLHNALHHITSCRIKAVVGREMRNPKKVIKRPYNKPHPISKSKESDGGIKNRERVDAPPSIELRRRGSSALRACVAQGSHIESR